MKLTWSSSNATSCTASGSSEWSGTKTLSGNQTVSPASMTTYTLKCTGAGGTKEMGVNISVDPAQLYVKSVLYTPSGQIDLIEYGNGVKTDYIYDARLRLKQLLTKDTSNNSIQDLNYSYDAVGNIVSIVDNVGTQHYALRAQYSPSGKEVWMVVLIGLMARIKRLSMMN